MKKILTAALLSSAMAGSAFAADLPSRKVPVYVPPPPVFTWTGFYVGLNAGGTVSGSNSAYTVSGPALANTGNVFTTNDAISILPFNAAASTGAVGFGNKSGAILGAQAGYNWQFGTPFLLGFEADIQGVVSSAERRFTSGFGGTTVDTLGNIGVTSPVIGGITISRRVDYLGTARVRAGYLVTPTFLLYATGGLAYGGVKSSTAATTTFTNPTLNVVATYSGNQGGMSTTKLGYAVGAGGEWMFLPNWSLKAEYMYYDLGSVTYFAGAGNLVASATNGAIPNQYIGTNASATRVRYNGHVARLGVNFHFWGPAPLAPVVARY